MLLSTPHNQSNENGPAILLLKWGKCCCTHIFIIKHSAKSESCTKQLHCFCLIALQPLSSIIQPPFVAKGEK